jgi:hypothetical protein
MKKIPFTALMVLCLLFLPTTQRTFADEAMTPDLSTLKWQMLQKWVSKTDMGPGLPEVAILIVSNGQFNQIYPEKKPAAMKYLDDQKIFKKKLIDVAFCDVHGSKSGTQWILIIGHTLHSTASIVAWQIPNDDFKD